MKDEETAETRRDRARVLRSIRTIDRPMAVWAIRRWRNTDEALKAAVDAVIFGTGFIKRVAPMEVAFHDPR